MREGRGSKKIEREGGNETSQIFAALYLGGILCNKDVMLCHSHCDNTSFKNQI